MMSTSLHSPSTPNRQSFPPESKRGTSLREQHSYWADTGHTHQNDASQGRVATMDRGHSDIFAPLTNDTHLYHVTAPENITSIIAQGLSGCRSGQNHESRLTRPGCVYLCTGQFAIDQAARDFGGEWGEVILRVSVARLDPRRFRGDEEYFRTEETWGDWSAASLVKRHPEMDDPNWIRVALSDDYGSVAYEGDIPAGDIELCWLPWRSDVPETILIRQHLSAFHSHVAPPEEEWIAPSIEDEHWQKPMPSLDFLQRLT